MMDRDRGDARVGRTAHGADSTSLAQKPEVAAAIQVLDAWIDWPVRNREQPGLSIGLVPGLLTPLDLFELAASHWNEKSLTAGDHPCLGSDTWPPLDQFCRNDPQIQIHPAALQEEGREA
jgi:hypothetical protein